MRSVLSSLLIVVVILTSLVPLASAQTADEEPNTPQWKEGVQLLCNTQSQVESTISFYNRGLDWFAAVRHVNSVEKSEACFIVHTRFASLGVITTQNSRTGRVEIVKVQVLGILVGFHWLLNANTGQLVRIPQWVWTPKGQPPSERFSFLIVTGTNI